MYTHDFFSYLAYEFSQQTKKRQLTSFKEWGLLADWKNSYFTCHPDYVINQLKVFQDLYEKVREIYFSVKNELICNFSCLLFYNYIVILLNIVQIVNHIYANDFHYFCA